MKENFFKDNSHLPLQKKLQKKYTHKQKPKTHELWGEPPYGYGGGFAVGFRFPQTECLRIKILVYV